VSAPEDPTVIGHIARPFGARGEVKVIVESHDPQRIIGMKRITVRLNSGYRSFGVKVVQQIGGWFRVGLEGVGSPEEAALLSGTDIVVPSSERPDLAGDDYYVDDVIGCLAVSGSGEEVGFVREVMHQEHHDLWVIDGPEGEVLVPAVREFISEVDLDRHRIVVKRVEELRAVR